MLEKLIQICDSVNILERVTLLGDEMNFKNAKGQALESIEPSVAQLKETPIRVHVMERRGLCGARKRAEAM